jgi:hypothetical protein
MQRPLSVSHHSQRSYCINSRNGGNQCQERRRLYLQLDLPGIPGELARARADSCQPRLQTASGRSLISRFRAPPRVPSSRCALLAHVTVKDLTLIRLQPNVCFCILWKPNCAWDGRRSAEMQPTGDLIAGYFCLSWGLRVASRDADTTGTTLQLVSRLEIAATKRRCL